MNYVVDNIIIDFKQCHNVVLSTWSIYSFNERVQKVSKKKLSRIISKNKRLSRTIVIKLLALISRHLNLSDAICPL